MPRAPNEKAETAKQMYLEGRKMVDIAAYLDIPEGTIRSWKNRYKWNATLQKDDRNVAKKCGAPVGNKNAAGGPPGNKKAEKFGFFSKYLPPETKLLTRFRTQIPLTCSGTRFRSSTPPLCGHSGSCTSRIRKTAPKSPAWKVPALKPIWSRWPGTNRPVSYKRNRGP